MSFAKKINEEAAFLTENAAKKCRKYNVYFKYLS